MKNRGVKCWHIGRDFVGLAIYGNPGDNPLLAVQRGPKGWLLQTRKRQWLSPKLRRWEADHAK